MNLPPVSPVQFRRLCAATLAASMIIVVTGAAVRLTGSGLGCPTWPNCRTGQLDATGLGLKGAIEFGNRIITVGITILVGLTAVTSFLLARRRLDLRVRAVGLVFGVIGDAVIGGITVLTHLDPVWVAAHFLFSMGLLVVALSLFQRAGYDEPPARLPAAPFGPERLHRLLSGVLVALGAFVLAAGTLTTGSGPHAGDAHARRLHLAALDRVTALHADSAMLLTGVVLATALCARVVPVADAARAALMRRRSALLAVVISGQAALGFAQYLLNLPATLVLLHVAGATVLWALTIRLRQAITFPALEPLRSRVSIGKNPVSPPTARLPDHVSGAEDGDASRGAPARVLDRELANPLG